MPATGDEIMFEDIFEILEPIGPWLWFGPAFALAWFFNFTRNVNLRNKKARAERAMDRPWRRIGR